MIQTALNWLYDNLYNYMIPVCGLCVLRVVVSLLELGHMKRLRDKKFVFRKVGVQYRDIGAFTGLFIGLIDTLDMYDKEGSPAPAEPAEEAASADSEE